MIFDPVLSVMSPLWAAINTVSRKLALPRAHRFDVPVISIGNIVAGGVGKTEIAAYLAEKLVARGKRVVVASRGYGSEWERRGGVAFDAKTAEAQTFPDESLVVLRKARGAMVAVGADRTGVLKRHWNELRPDVILLDDGFQHFRIARDLDVLVHDFNVRWPILRDFPNQFENAAVRIALSDIPKSELKQNPWVRAKYELSSIVNPTDERKPWPQRALVFCGIGNPKRLRDALVAKGVAVEGLRLFRDHKRYTQEDVRALIQWRKGSGGLPLLTTLKDYVKVQRFIPADGFEPHWIEINLKFLEGEDLLWKAVDGVLAVRTS
jgi:tetraacyldisaccharide 4'-kinase